MQVAEVSGPFQRKDVVWNDVGVLLQLLKSFLENLFQASFYSPGRESSRAPKVSQVALKIPWPLVQPGNLEQTGQSVPINLLTSTSDQLLDLKVSGRGLQAAAALKRGRPGEVPKLWTLTLGCGGLKSSGTCVVSERPPRPGRLAL